MTVEPFVRREVDDRAVKRKKLLNKRVKIFFCLLFLVFSPVPSFSRVIGTFGKVYPIVEKSALKEIEERVREIDIADIIRPEEIRERLKNYRPPNVSRLGHATKDRTFLVDMTYTLPFDIPDGRGGILYPKGFTFNPLEYVPFSRTLVVIDGTEEREVEWFLSSEYSKRRDVMLLITDGSWYNLSQKLGVPVYYLTEPIRARLGLEKTPSMVYKKDSRHLEVREVGVVGR